MGKKNYRKITVPEFGEDLLESIEAMADSTISITTCASVAEANLIADTAIKDGKVVNALNPMVFWINASNLYVHNGQRIRPANMKGFWRNTKMGTGNWWNLEKDKWQQIGSTSPCPARPYDRCITAQANINANIGRGDDNQPGWAYMAVEINGVRGPFTRMDEGMVEGTSAYDFRFVPAGEAPNVRMMFTARGANIKYQIDPSLSSLHVTEEPISMDMA